MAGPDVFWVEVEDAAKDDKVEIRDVIQVKVVDNADHPQGEVLLRRAEPPGLPRRAWAPGTSGCSSSWCRATAFMIGGWITEMSVGPARTLK